MGKKNDVPQWTHETLRQFVFSKIEALEKLVFQRFDALDKAVNKAEQAQSDYNVRSNEFRGQLDDQAKTLMPRSEASVQYAALAEKIENFRTAAETARGILKATSDERLENVNKRLAAIDLLMAGVVRVEYYDTRHTELQRQVDDLKASRSIGQGASAQTEKMASNERWAIGIGITIAIVVLNIVIAVVMKLIFK